MNIASACNKVNDWYSSHEVVGGPVSRMNEQFRWHQQLGVDLDVTEL
jgi:hypothetical protein